MYQGYNVIYVQICVFCQERCVVCWRNPRPVLVIAEDIIRIQYECLAGKIVNIHGVSDKKRYCECSVSA